MQYKFHFCLFPYGKVECSHCKDNEYFHEVKKFYLLNDFKTQLATHNCTYNSSPIRPLKWQNPKQAHYNFLSLGVTYY